MDSQNSSSSVLWLIVIGFFTWLVFGFGCTPEAPPVEPAAPIAVTERLTIITPHNSHIREAFENGFSDWYFSRTGDYVQVEWIVLGTPLCVDYVDQIFSEHTDGPVRRVPDIMFGGGVTDHAVLAKRGQCQPLELGDVLTNIPAAINGLPTRDEKGQWFATGLSSIGLLVNKRCCTERGISFPGTWSDLADPQYYSWIGMADPEASGSHRQAMVFTLQSLGWEKGWPVLLRMMANSRAIVGGSRDVLNHIGNGVFLAGFCVNFDGLARVDASGGEMSYINPAGATVATPAVLSVLRTARDVGLAEQFVRFCFSEKGQLLWCARADALEYSSDTLYHYPIDPTVYEKFADKLAVKENPFETDFGLHLDLAKAEAQAGALLVLVEAATGKNHIALQNTWMKIIDAGMNPEQVQMLCAPPLPEEQMLDLGRQYLAADQNAAAAMVEEWSAKFSELYSKVAASVTAG